MLTKSSSDITVLTVLLQIKALIIFPSISMCSHTELWYQKNWTNMYRKEWSPEQCPGILSSNPVWRWSWCRPWSTLPDFPTPRVWRPHWVLPSHSCFYFPNNKNSRNTSVFMLHCWQFTKKCASNSFYPNRQRHAGSKTEVIWCFGFKFVLEIQFLHFISCLEQISLTFWQYS